MSFHLCEHTFNVNTRLPTTIWQNWSLRAVIEAVHPVEDHLVVEDHLAVVEDYQAVEDLRVVEDHLVEEAAEEEVHRHPVHPEAVHLAVVVVVGEAATVVEVAVVDVA